jgi:hypothetical protein
MPSDIPIHCQDLFFRNTNGETGGQLRELYRGRYALKKRVPLLLTVAALKLRSARGTLRRAGPGQSVLSALMRLATTSHGPTSISQSLAVHPCCSTHRSTINQEHHQQGISTMNNMNVVQSIGQGEAHESGVTRTDLNDLMPTQTASILSTARSPITGGPPSSLTGSTLISHGGMQLTLKDAVRHGLVTRDANGSYSDGSGVAPAQAQAAAQEAPVEQASADNVDIPVAFAPTQEAALHEFASQLPPSIQSAVIAQAIAGDGVDASQAHAAGMDPAQFSASVDSAIHAFQSQTDSYVASKGVDPAAFYQYLATCGNSWPDAPPQSLQACFGRSSTRPAQTPHRLTVVATRRRQGTGNTS